MICCRIEDGPAAPMDYHLMAANTPPRELVLGQPAPGGPWTRLLTEDKVDPDMNPQFYELADAMPVALDDDGEPIYSFTLREP